MSLNKAEMARTGEELRRHAQATGLDAVALGAWLGVDEGRVDDVLWMRGSDPVLTWLMRDALDGEARRQGIDAGGWSVLTDAARRKAVTWYALREVPPRPVRGAGPPVVG